MRTADGLGVARIWCVGITPANTLDTGHLPHVQARHQRAIAKTALGAEQSIDVRYFATIEAALKATEREQLAIVALEQTASSIKLSEVSPPKQCALIAGSEVNGVSSTALKAADQVIEIPMQGLKKSLNVSVATGIALYALQNVAR